MKVKNSNKHPEYYEAIIQLRPASPKLVDFIACEIERRPDVKISKIVDFKTGIDIYLTNQRFARSTLAPMIKRKFDGKLTITKALYGRHRQTNKLIYRATILFRMKEDSDKDEEDKDE
ncbi:MAG: NMD3-related protein [Nanoarchaeota archaeon]